MKKALFIGLGGIGQRHLRNLVDLLDNDVEIIAWRHRGLTQVLTDDLRIEDGQDLEQRYDIKALGSLDEAMAEKPDITFICNPSSLHIEPARRAVEAGSHVFLEKPLSHTLDGVDDLITAARERNRIGYVGFQLRFHPCIKELKRLLDESAVGRVLGVRAIVAEHLPDFHKYEDYRQIYASRKDLGGGVILSQIHELDFLQWLFGMPRRVAAMGGQLSSLDVDVDDVANLLMECGSAESPVGVSVYMDFVQRPPYRTCEVMGDQGRITIDFHKLSLVHYGADGSVAHQASWLDFPRNDIFKEQMAHFLACCAGQEEPLVSLEEGRKSLAIAVAALKALETGNFVKP